MFGKILDYAGENKKYIYLAVCLIFLAVFCKIVPYFCVYTLIEPLVRGETLAIDYVAVRLVVIAAALLASVFLYSLGLKLSHKGAYQTLENVSLTVPQKTKTAIVGESGSGKSTLAKLLVHFYDINKGRIMVGCNDISKLSLSELSEQISFVSQEQFLFNVSLRENIRMGKRNATDGEVLEAARRARCMEFIERLPNGIDSMAGDSGKMLSGGERQRISIARAILKDTPVIILDEATALVDPENEAKMNEAIAEVVKDKTVIVIAHRLRSIMNSDQIVVLKDKKINGLGTHKELLRTCDEYVRLWNRSENVGAWKIGGRRFGKYRHLRCYIYGD